MIDGSGCTMYNTECTLVQNNRNTDLHVLFIIFIMEDCFTTDITTQYVFQGHTHTGSIVAWGGAVES